MEVGAACTLSDGTQGTAQLQGLGTSLSCIGASFGPGSKCFLPNLVTGTLDADGKTCNPPKEPPPPGDSCPLPGSLELGQMQSDGKTCLPPTQSGGGGGSGNGGSSGGSAPPPNGGSGTPCAIAGDPGFYDNGVCRRTQPLPGDPCYRGGGGAFFSNALPDGIFASDGTTCMVMNDTCSSNGVQGRYSPSYTCSVPPPAAGIQPTYDGEPCQRNGMWGGRWNASSSTCNLPGDPCGDGILAANAYDCIPKPPSGTSCTTAQGFNGTYNNAGMCAATVPPGIRTPCLSVSKMAGAIARGNANIACQIPPTPDTPEGLLESIQIGSYCANGRDAGIFTDIIECAIQQRSGGINDIPQGAPGNPNNDVASIATVSKTSSKGTPGWVAGVATAAAVVVAAIVFFFLGRKCGWFASCSRRKRSGATEHGAGGILDEEPYEPQPTTRAAYRDYAPTSTNDTPYTDSDYTPTYPGMSQTGTASNGTHTVASFLAVAPPGTAYSGITSESSLQSNSYMSATSGSSNGHNTYGSYSWDGQHRPGLETRTTAGSVSAHMGSPPYSPPGSPPTAPQQPLLSNYGGMPANPRLSKAREAASAPPYTDPFQ